MIRRQFVDITDPDDPRLAELSRKWAALTREDLGREVARFRAWPTGRLVLGTLAVVAVASAVLVALPIEGGWAYGFAIGVGALLMLVVFGATGVAEKQRVCEHGLAVGFRRNTTLLIPWETIGPGRVHIRHNAPAAGRYPDVGLAQTVRVGMISTRVLIVNGLNSASWDPPFVHWMLGTPNPHKLAAAIEKAMIADGYPAHGLAANATRTAVTAHWRPHGNLLTERPPLDPLIGLPTDRNRA